VSDQAYEVRPRNAFFSSRAIRCASFCEVVSTSSPPAVRSMVTALGLRVGRARRDVRDAPPDRVFVGGHVAAP